LPPQPRIGDPGAVADRERPRAIPEDSWLHQFRDLEPPDPIGHQNVVVVRPLGPNVAYRINQELTLTKDVTEITLRLYRNTSEFTIKTKTRPPLTRVENVDIEAVAYRGSPHVEIHKTLKGGDLQFMAKQTESTCNDLGLYFHNDAVGFCKGGSHGNQVTLFKKIDDDTFVSYGTAVYINDHFVFTHI
jgi:hypothetical protein